MTTDISVICNVIDQMDTQLRTTLLMKDGHVQAKKLWENTYIKKQIDRRKAGDTRLSIQEHICAMVYAMLSSGISWNRVESSIDESSGKITAIDNIFHQYEPKRLLSCSPDELTAQIKALKCAGQSTKKQMETLIHTNIPKMMLLENEYGSIDGYYQKFIEHDKTMKLLVQQLSDSNSPDKYAQMAEPLNAEYLRNVGYDIAKPDRHICRILGCNYLCCSEHEIVPIYEAFDIVRELAEYMDKNVAEVDYILWSYCANGYGEICVKNKWNCRNCMAKEICKSAENYCEV